ADAATPRPAAFINSRRFMTLPLSPVFAGARKDFQSEPRRLLTPTVRQAYAITHGGGKDILPRLALQHGGVGSFASGNYRRPTSLFGLQIGRVAGIAGFAQLLDQRPELIAVLGAAGIPGKLRGRLRALIEVRKIAPQ